MLEILFDVIALEHEPDAKFVTVIVVPALSGLVNPTAVKVPVPAVVTVIEAVNPVALGSLLV